MHDFQLAFCKFAHGKHSSSSLSPYDGIYPVGWMYVLQFDCVNLIAHSHTAFDVAPTSVECVDLGVPWSVKYELNSIATRPSSIGNDLHVWNYLHGKNDGNTLPFREIPVGPRGRGEAKRGEYEKESPRVFRKPYSTDQYFCEQHNALIFVVEQC